MKSVIAALILAIFLSACSTFPQYTMVEGHNYSAGYYRLLASGQQSCTWTTRESKTNRLVATGVIQKSGSARVYLPKGSFIQATCPYVEKG